MECMSPLNRTCTYRNPGIPVSSEVPQGSVLDDTAMYLALSTHVEGQVLQNDLFSLEKMGKDVGYEL